VDRTAARAEDFMHDVWSSADGVSWQREVETTPWAGRRTSVGITYQTNIFMFVESSQFRYIHHTESTSGAHLQHAFPWYVSIYIQMLHIYIYISFASKIYMYM
jgi:hypothetical protein